jgi:hypothetical protein
MVDGEREQFTTLPAYEYQKNAEKDVISSDYPASKDAALNVYGFLVSTGNRYPLAELDCKAYFYDSSEGDNNKVNKTPQHEFLIGSAKSGPRGEFHITFFNTPKIQQQLCLLKQCPGVSLILKVFSPTSKVLKSANEEEDRRKPILVSKPFAGDIKQPIVLEVPLLIKTISKSLWKEFAARLDRSHITRLNEIANQLLLIPSTHSIFGDWNIEIRYSLLIALEEAFLDPKGYLRKAGIKPMFSLLISTGKRLQQPNFEKDTVNHLAAAITNARNWGNIFSVGIYVDAKLISVGNLSDAFHKDLSHAVHEDVPGLQIEEQPEKAPDNLISYRNYLLDIFTIAPSTIPDTSINYLSIIENRFHQDFTTDDLERHSLSHVLIPIVKAILTSAKPYGFGIDPGTIASQGTKSDNEYLDYLIECSSLDAHELGVRYCLNLDRDRNIRTSPVEENIATLQGFYRDSFQDYNDRTAIYPPELCDRAPFFLEYDEWIRYIEPFFAENYYNAKHPIIVLTDENLEELEDLTPFEDKNFVKDVLKLQDKMNKGHEAYNVGQYGIARNLPRGRIVSGDDT